jgi:transcription elongation factor GreA
VDELVRRRQWESLKELTDQLMNHFREYREAFVWMARNLVDEPWFGKMGVKPEKLFISLIHLLDITYREINNKKDVSLNRKINNQIQDYLFKEKRLLKYILETGEEAITRLYTLVDDVRELDPSIKIGLKQQIKERYPHHQFIGDQEKEKVSMGLLTTRGSYEAKQKELRHIVEVEIPQNSQEIGVAMTKGDLRENAEYKAALERQELLKSAASKLQDELQRAQIADAAQISADAVAFGTTVTLKNLLTGEVEQYTIMGPWESDPARNVISYRSPLGAELVNHRKGDELELSIGEKSFKYSVQDIEVANLTGV